ncbi:MAG: hypothetical protein DRJ42_20465 [Deltaproteobacteria bacterium]|nr:MAG: hypothetical protein DRJ42_20465 [Deltaproteobacteria bacterium]
MKRKILIAFLAAGTVLGFGTGVHSLHHHRQSHDRMAQRLSRVCVDSALAARDGGDELLAATAPTGRHAHFARVEREVRYRCAAEGRRHRR